MQHLEDTLVSKHHKMNAIKQVYILTNVSLDKLKIYDAIKQSVFEENTNLIERYQNILDTKQEQERQYYQHLEDYNSFLDTYNLEMDQTIHEYRENNLKLSILTKNLLKRLLSPSAANTS